MPEFHLGMNAKIYQGAAGDAGDALAALTEMGNVKDVTLNLEAKEEDATTRENGGWEAAVTTLRKCSAEFQMRRRTDDPQFQAIKTAYLASGQVRLAILTGAKSADDGITPVVGSEGPLADFSVTNCSRGEPINGVVMADVSVTMSKFIEWIIDGCNAV